MPDNKLTDSEIIKALECCNQNDCRTCPYGKYNVTGWCCMPKARKDALDLINRLQAEIEHIDNESSALLADIDFRENEIDRLQAEKQDLEIELKAMRGAANSYKAENERLQATIDSFTDIGKLYSEIKAEAYKEFAELCKQKGIKVTGGRGFEGVTTMTTNVQIDNLLKELVGDNQ